jgi:hypothetical protein
LLGDTGEQQQILVLASLGFTAFPKTHRFRQLDQNDDSVLPRLVAVMAGFAQLQTSGKSIHMKPGVELVGRQRRQTPGPRD